MKKQICSFMIAIFIGSSTSSVISCGDPKVPPVNTQPTIKNVTISNDGKLIYLEYNKKHQLNADDFKIYFNSIESEHNKINKFLVFSNDFSKLSSNQKYNDFNLYFKKCQYLGIQYKDETLIDINTKNLKLEMHVQNLRLEKNNYFNKIKFDLTFWEYWNLYGQSDDKYKINEKIIYDDQKSDEYFREGKITSSPVDELTLPKSLVNFWGTVLIELQYWTSGTVLSDNRISEHF